MQKRILPRGPLVKILNAEEAFAEIEHLVALYEQEPLLLGACQIRFRHLDVSKLSPEQKMEIAADVRPALMEIKRFLEQQKRTRGNLQ